MLCSRVVKKCTGEAHDIARHARASSRCDFPVLQLPKAWRHISVTRPFRGLPGYPSDKGNQMWFSTCDHQKLSLTEGTAFPYTCDTMPGNSGGPIWCGPWGRGVS